MSDDIAAALLNAVVDLLVKATATGLWQSARDRVASAFGRGDHERDRSVRAQLDEPDRGADPTVLAAELRGTLRTLLADAPEAASELRRLLAGHPEPDDRRNVVVQTATATHRSTIYQAGRDISGQTG